MEKMSFEMALGRTCIRDECVERMGTRYVRGTCRLVAFDDRRVQTEIGKSEHLYSALHGTNHSKALRHGSHSFQPSKNTMPAFTS